MMNMKKMLLYFSLLCACVSCRTDVIGGSVNETNRVDITTYEWLLQEETTAVVGQLFEKAGLKDVIESDVTVISPSKYSVNRYLRRRNYGVRNGVEGAVPFALEDMDEAELARMGMYIFPGKWGREDIPEEGVYLTSVDGSQEIYLTLDETKILIPVPHMTEEMQPGPGSSIQISFLRLLRLSMCFSREARTGN